jgi:nucleotide-binding universal stress UspA family protein
MKNILFPTDFSQASENALSYAVSLAAALQVKLDVIHVFKLPAVDATNVPADYIGQLIDERKQSVTKNLHDFTIAIPASVLGTSEAVHGIFAPEEIISYSDQHRHSMIIMGTRGEHLSKIEKFFGSVTSHTILNANCAVIAVPIDSSWKGIRHITYATDLMSKEESAVKQARSFAQNLNASLDFVHIETEPGVGRMMESVTLDKYPFTDTELIVVNNPSVMEGIDTFIEEKSVDLLAMFAPKRGLWEKLFHQSVTKMMSFHSKTPILVLHETPTI